MRNETVASAALDQTWQRISGELAASDADRHLQLQFAGGPGMVFLDTTVIRNITSVA